MECKFEYRPIHGQRKRKHAPVAPYEPDDELRVTWKMIGALIGSWVFIISMIFLFAYLGNRFNW